MTILETKDTLSEDQEPEKEPEKKTELQETKIGPVVPLGSRFYSLRIFWQKYVVFQQKFWRGVIFIALITSTVLLYPYTPLLFPQVSPEIPRRRLPISVDLSPTHTVDLQIVLPKYIAPGRVASFEFFLQQNLKPDEDHKVVFRLGVDPKSEDHLLSQRRESLFVEGIEGSWETASILEYKIPTHLQGSKLDLWLQTEIISGDRLLGKLTLQDVQIRVVRWPSYVIQLIAFLGTLGLFGYNQIGAMVSFLVGLRGNKKPKE